MRNVARKEKKYLIDAVMASQLQHRLRSVLTEDSHNGLHGYVVRSLYFDTLHSRDFADKLSGIGKRQKVRLRSYGPDFDVWFLELKQKDGENGRKCSLRVEPDVAEQLVRGHYSSLLGIGDPFAGEMYAFMTAEGYRPSAVVEYDRSAYIAQENSTRITFDRSVRANEANFNVLDPHLCLYPVFNPFNVVLEVKYNGFLLSYIQSELNSIDKRELSVSKYCLGRTVSQAYEF